MPDIIKLLPDSVANQIAAGEVIQRPASVIKELVENSIDAGATDIQIYIKDAGRTLIQVVDNGKGMTPTDARMAFERHATSKIREAADLFSLHTMGFRGEALPSICAISQIELRTRTVSDPIGTRLVINATKVENQESVACDAGANIMVKNLFFNVPARRKFLKSDNVELSNILREFERLALVNNSVRMKIDTGSRVIDLKPASFHQRIVDIWKNSLDLHLIPIEVDTSLVKISGYISRPEYARRRNPLQYLIVNGRNMRHPYFHKAITGCYEPLIAPDTQPCYFLKFTVDPESIDVNIHPTKNEIKFEYEQDIWPILQAAVKAALGKFGAVPSIDFSVDVLPSVPLEGSNKPVEPKISVPEDYNPFAGALFNGQTNKPTYSYPKKNNPPSRWDNLYSEFIKGAHGFGDKNEEEKDKGTIPGFSKEISPEQLCLQFNDNYIVTTSREGVIIVDQRRAHIKILFEEYLSHIRSEEHSTQGVMFPDSIEIDQSQLDTFEEILPELNKIGFLIEYDSDKRWNITGVPSFAKNLNAREIVHRMIDSADDAGVNYGKDSRESFQRLPEKLALVMARGSAIHYGQKLTTEEMEHIVSKLFALPDPSFTPNGQKIFYMIELSSLQSIFKK